MSTSISDGRVRVTLTGTEVSTVGAGGVSSSVALPGQASSGGLVQAGVYGPARANGTGNGQVNAVFSLTGTITSGTPLDIDFHALAQGGRTLVLTGIKDLLIQEISATPNSSNNLVIGDSSGTLTNAWTAPWSGANDTEVVGSQGAFYRGNYYGLVVDNTHKVLRLTASAGTVVFQLDGLGTQ